MIREYFWENNRDWNDKIWDAAKKLAESLVSSNQTYIKSNPERQALILEKITCQHVPQMMSVQYRFVDNSKSGFLSYKEAKDNGVIIDEDSDDNVKTYSEEWCGMFTKKEIAWLNAYYKKLSKNGELEFDATQDDYAHKIAHASLMNNKATSDFNAGRCDYSVVKDTAAIFDMYNKSANFAACKKKEKEEEKRSSFSELVAYLESHGHPCTRKIEWPKDDVDLAIEELRHIVRAIGLDE